MIISPTTSTLTVSMASDTTSHVQDDDKLNVEGHAESMRSSMLSMRDVVDAWCCRCVTLSMHDVVDAYIPSGIVETN
jgi:hypothetical protein